MPQKHINWVDLARGIAILMVVLGHIATPFTNFIFSWHMPMFFFLSGFFLKKPVNYIYKFTNDAKKLMFPYFIFALIGLIAEITKRRLFPDYTFITPHINLTDELRGIFIWMDITSMHTYGFVLWFLPTLFWSRILASWFIFKVNSIWFSIAVSLGMYLLLINRTVILPMALDKGLLVTIWVMLGYYCYSYFERVKPRLINTYAVILASVLVFLPVPILNIAYKNGSNPIYNFVYSLIIIFVILAVCKTMGDNPNLKWLRYFGVGSLTVFVTHPYTNNLAYIISNTYHQGYWTIELVISVLLIFTILRAQEYYQYYAKNI